MSGLEGPLPYLGKEKKGIVLVKDTEAAEPERQLAVQAVKTAP